MSSTPDTEGSMGARNARHCTWIILCERETGWRFAVFNTHLDRWGVKARVEAARLIVARAALAQGLRYVAMGDFNAYEDAEPLAILRAAGLRDTFRELHPDVQDVQTRPPLPPALGQRENRLHPLRLGLARTRRRDRP
ncbi:MAG: hypothetical protein ACRDTT_31520 [Pseudonocardiaceae bacterium]